MFVQSEKGGFLSLKNHLQRNPNRDIGLAAAKIHSSKPFLSSVSFSEGGAEIETSADYWFADEAGSGKSEGASGLKLFLAAVGEDLAQAIRLAAEEQEVELKHFDIEVQGNLSLSRLLDPEEQVQVDGIQLKVNFPGEEPPNRLTGLVKQAQSRAPILNTIRQKSTVTVKPIEREEG